MAQVPAQFENVALKLKANVYFDGGVVSHTVVLADKSRKTVGVIHPGQYHFTTDASERMDIIAGTCRVKLAGEGAFKNYKEGEGFDVPAKSSFDIAVDGGLAEYLCTFG